MSKNYQNVNNLKISEELLSFVNKELLKDLDISSGKFWEGFDKAVHDLAPKNKELIQIRENLQKKIDDWHIKNKGNETEIEQYKKFLKEIGYLKEEGPDFKIETSNVDDEIAQIAGPQLVVPIMNARYTLNAANARWVSLYDSLYGTNIIESEEGGSERYDPNRGQEVIKYVREFFDKYIPIDGTSWKNISALKIKDKNLIILKEDKEYKLKDENKFVGHRGDVNKPTAIIIKNNNLHFEIIINPKAFSAAHDIAGISDVIAESAVSTICDNEDSVAAVDAEDKVACYRNWLGLMRGDLKVQFEKNGKKLERKLNPDRSYISKEGKGLKLHGRSLLLIRNVGHLMTNSSIILNDGSEVPEGIMDAFITTTAALHDFKKKKNSRTGSIYIVKPKMHGPDETAFTDLIFSKVEELLGLQKYTCKIGIMDEERRTSANLKECIRTLKNRVFFINTGFLDRTGDEMHTSMEAGPMIKKGDMKSSRWISAYENNNVDIGLKCGFSGKAQIGKGMWAMPDKMKEMLDEKISHLKAGANCAWVPSPTAASLHALHYHQINIFDEQKKIMKREQSKLDDLLTIPVADRPNWSVDEIKRISSQHIANWIHHGITTKIQVMEIMKAMAKVVDKQNENDKNYIKMSDNFENSLAFKTACDLIFKGKDQPSGYTEPLLHLNRIEKKSSLN